LPFEVGLQDADEAQILEGIAKDEDVVATPSREIDAGMRVTTTLIGEQTTSAQ
jgi:hypothetical protein